MHTNKKKWRFDGYISDTILIHSNSFKELKTPQVMSFGFEDAQIFKKKLENSSIEYLILFEI